MLGLIDNKEEICSECTILNKYARTWELRTKDLERRNENLKAVNREFQEYIIHLETVLRFRQTVV